MAVLYGYSKVSCPACGTFAIPEADVSDAEERSVHYKCNVCKLEFDVTCNINAFVIAREFAKEFFDKEAEKYVEKVSTHDPIGGNARKVMKGGD